MLTTAAVVIRTIDRTLWGKRNYLTETLQNLERSGLRQSKTSWSLHIVDGGSPHPEAFVREALAAASLDVTADGSRPTHVHLAAPTPQTPNDTAAAWWRVGAGTKAAWVIALEDDIDVCDAFLDETMAWLAHHARPDRHLYPLGCPHQDIAEAHAAGETAWEYPLPRYWGSQASAARRADAMSLAIYLATHPLSHGTNTQSADWLMAEWAARTWPESPAFRTPVPSLVQHIGEDSVLAVTRVKESPDAIVFFEYPCWRGKASRKVGG